MVIDVILPAGGRIAGLTAKTGTDVKALFPLAGKSLLRRTLQTLRATSCFGKIVVVGPPEVAKDCGAEVAAFLPETDSGANNVLRGLSWLRANQPESSSRRLLLMGTDLPFVTPAALRHFLDACPPEAELCLPVIERREFEARFPHQQTKYVPLRDGQWMIGCTMLVNPAIFIRNEPLIRRLFAARRSTLAMARLLGLRFIFGLLMHQLTIAQVQEKCLSLLGCSGQAIYGCPPELGFDIDYPSDYQYATQHIQLAWSLLGERCV